MMRTLAISCTCLFLLIACGQGGITNNDITTDFVFAPRETSNIKWAVLSTDTDPDWQTAVNIEPRPGTDTTEYHFNRSTTANKYRLAYLEEVGSNIKLSLRYFTFDEIPVIDEQRFFDIEQTDAGISGSVNLSETGTKAMVASSGNYPQSGLGVQNNIFNFSGANRISDLLAMEYLDVDNIYKTPRRFYIDRQLDTGTPLVRNINFSSAQPLQSYVFDIMLAPQVSHPSIDVRFRTSNGAEVNGLYDSATKLGYLPVNNVVSGDTYYLSVRDQSMQGSSSSGFDVEYFFSALVPENKNINLGHLPRADNINLIQNQITGLDRNPIPQNPPLLGWTINLSQKDPTTEQINRIDMSLSASWLEERNTLKVPDSNQFSRFGGTVKFDPQTVSTMISTRTNATNADALLSTYWSQNALPDDRVERQWSLKEVFVE